MNIAKTKVRLHHMLDASREVVAFCGEHTRDDLDTNRMFLRALSMSLGIIGEAASHIEEDFREKYSSIPWRQIIGMRNFLFHEYFRVDPDILWETATKAVQPLIPQLEKILSDLESDND